MLQGPPAIDNGPKAPLHIGVPPDTWTPEINPNPNDTARIPDSSAGGDSSLAGPTQPASLPPQPPHHDTMGRQCYPALMGGIYTDLAQQESKYYHAWFELHEKTSKQIHEMTMKIVTLTVVSPPLIFSTLSNCYFI